MSPRARIVAGLAAAMVAGLVGPSLTAVATHTGSGHSSIRGRVTDQHGAPIHDICVSAYHRYVGVGTLPESYPVYAAAGITTTLADGTYAIGRLSPDLFRVKFEQCLTPPTARTWITEWWNDKLVAEMANRVEVPNNGYDAVDINAVLARL